MGRRKESPAEVSKERLADISKFLICLTAYFPKVAKTEEYEQFGEEELSMLNVPDFDFSALHVHVSLTVSITNNHCER